MQTSDAIAHVVLKQLQDDFPTQDAKWVLSTGVSWAPLAQVPVSKIDFANEKQWNAYAHKAKIQKFVQKIHRGDRKPVILARVKDNAKLVVLDGHHRSLAYKQMGGAITAYVVTITDPKAEECALEMHASQRSGNSGPAHTPVKDRAVKFSNERCALELTAETPVVSTVHHPFGKPGGPGLWRMKGVQLPAYIQNVAHALLRDGSASDESDAIHKAVGIVMDWARGKATSGKTVTSDVQAAAQRAMLEWYQKRGQRASLTGAKSFKQGNR